MKGETLRGEKTQIKGPKKRKNPRGNNSRKKSSRKLRVKKEWRERKIERKKVVKRREKTLQEERCINRLSFPSLLSNPLFGIPKVVTSSHLGLFSKMHNFDSKSL